MLRIVQRRLWSSKGRPSLYQRFVRFQSQNAAETAGASGAKPKRRGKFMKRLAFAVSAAVGGAGAGIGYAFIDPVFRQQLEMNLPQVKGLLDSVLGEPPFRERKTQLWELKEKAKNALATPKKKEPTEGGQTVDSVTADAVATQSLLKTSKTPDKQTVQKSQVQSKQSVPETATSSAAMSATTAQPSAKTQANADLEERIKYAITSAEKKLETANETKKALVAAVGHHARLLRHAVDDPQDPKWSEVAGALDQMQYEANRDSNAEMDLRNYSDNLRKILNDGRSSTMTADNPILLNATETLNRFQYQLDQLIAQVNEARRESRIMTEYRDLIDKSRQQFAKELKSILPNIDLHAKEAKLTEDELNALIAHAHLRVDQLRKQLTEQQLREEQHIGEAIERQKAEDTRAAEERLLLEVDRLQGQTDLDIERKLADTRVEWEEDLRTQLRRAAGAHSEHLEEVVRAQKELLELEHSRLRDEAVQLERDIYHRQVGAALARLDGIEVALDSRAAQDAENRHAKELWLACQNLLESVVHGRKAGADCELRRQPLANELMAIKEASVDDGFVTTVLRSLSDECLYEGVYTEDDLKSRFSKVYKLGWRTAKIDDNGGTLMQYMWSTLMSMLMTDVRKQYADDERLDPNKLDTFAVLSRARYYVFEKDDFAAAVRLLQLLRGEPRRVARDWIEAARLHLETKQAAQLLMTHAAAKSMRSVY